MSYTHLTPFERSRLETLSNLGFSTRHIAKQLNRHHSSIVKGTFKSYTVDRGKEFSCYQEIERELGRPVYFADAYSSWQRGSNENANGLLREFFPKKTDLAQVSPKELNQALYQINSRPRKCLQGKTSFAAFYEELWHLT